MCSRSVPAHAILVVCTVSHPIFVQFQISLSADFTQRSTGLGKLAGWQSVHVGTPFLGSFRTN